jgi:hypothetical protein
LRELGINAPDELQLDAELIWMHALAIGFAPKYSAENGDAVRRDWPRIPLPKDKATLSASAGLGRIVADLLDVEIAIGDVRSLKTVSTLKQVAIASRHDGGSIDPTAGDLDVKSG